MKKLILEDITYDIIGSCMEVHNELGCGFLEGVHQEALEIVFIQRGIVYEREKELSIKFKNEFLRKKYIADFVCYDKIIVELKELSDLEGTHEAQVFNYLKVTAITPTPFDSEGVK